MLSSSMKGYLGRSGHRAVLLQSWSYWLNSDEQKSVPEILLFLGFGSPPSNPAPATLVTKLEGSASSFPVCGKFPSIRGCSRNPWAQSWAQDLSQFLPGNRGVLGKGGSFEDPPPYNRLESGMRSAFKLKPATGLYSKVVQILELYFPVDWPWSSKLSKPYFLFLNLFLNL